MDPLSLGFASAALLSYGGYLRQQPTTESVETMPPSQKTVPDQRRTLRTLQIILNKPNLTAFSGMRSNNPVMLDDQRNVYKMPKRWSDNPMYMKWRRSHKALLDKRDLRSVSIDSGSDTIDAREQMMYKKWIRRYGTTYKTFMQYLNGMTAETQRLANSLASGRSGIQYITDKEVSAPLVRKLNQNGRFNPAPNYIDDSVYSVAQRGMAQLVPPFTKSGASNMYMLRQNANDGPYNNPTKMAPSRVERAGNVVQPLNGLTGRRIPASAFSR